MTKEQMKKHKDVIKWLCDNIEKGVWARYELPEIDSYTWELQSQPDWNADVYIQNDEYLKFRKALVDGETVQLDNSHCYRDDKIKSWIKVDKISDHIPVEHYRIKPKTPTFKTGEWVIDKNGRKGIINTIKLGSKKPINVHFVNDADWVYAENIEKWFPKKYELCVFWDNGCDEYFIGRYGKVALKATFGDISEVDYYYSDNWDNIAPIDALKILNFEEIGE